MQYKVLISILYVFAILQLSAQNQEIELNIMPYFDDIPILIKDDFVSTYKEKPIQINELKFYISNIRLLDDQRIVYAPPDSYYLIDASIEQSSIIKIACPPSIVFNTIKFDIGIDSITNVSGVYGGVLDPTNGMYWTWQSGYINFKLEGQHESTKIPNRSFQYHIGGYSGENNSLQSVEFPLQNYSKIALALDIRNILNQTDMSAINHIMSPGWQSVQFSNIIKSSFKILNH